MSPRSTLRICGSSSRLQRRSQAPTRVRRGSCFILNIGPEYSFSAPSSSRWLSAPTFMERNLKMWNVLPSRPMRSWRKNTGPGESSLMSTAKATSGGQQQR